MLHNSAKIIGTGAFIPEWTITSEDFLQTDFLNNAGEAMTKPNEEILAKFEAITGITERRYAEKEKNTSDMAFLAAQKAVEEAQIDPNTLDYVIFSHNFGNVDRDKNHYDLLPNLGARLKHDLNIKNSNCVAYDILFGCPGWVQAAIQANCFIKIGEAKRVLVVGADTVSRVVDPHDRDSMLFSDGAGAVILEAVSSDQPVGILQHKAISDCLEEADYLKMGYSFNPDKKEEGYYVKMQGRHVFRYGLEKVPQIVAECIKDANLQLKDIKMMLFHQANRKMIEQMAKKLYGAEGIDHIPEDALPINVDSMGNNSVATIPILLDSIRKNQFEGYQIREGDHVVFASVGSGMHANCMIYRF